MNKGFTLVELLAVISILILIFLLVFPAVNTVLTQSEETVYQKQINTILDAAYDWSLKNIKNLPTSDKSYVTLSELRVLGLVDDNLTDPNSNEPFPDDLVVSIEKVENSYKNENINAKKYGEYLYTIEESSSSKPSIVLNGLTPNSSGDYVTTVSLNEVLEEVTFKATSSSGVDLTDKVIVRIMKDKRTCEKISTDESGIYYVYYTVIDEFGAANSVTRTIIVGDFEAPILTVPENVTISTSATSYDLMKGASCTDNSKICDITTSGEITFGVKDKYVIEYTAKDPSGNIDTKRRVITVE